jgi:conjugal transfer pilus assembly protein TraB
VPLGQAAAGQVAMQPAPDPYAPSLMRVSLAPTKAGEAAPIAAQPVAAGAPAAPGAQAKAVRTLNSFLPVGFTRAVLLGGLAAPTGGQAQANPVPVLLRMADLSVLPNGYRAMVKDCLVIGEGYGEHSAERAYIRATLLSCVMRDGQVLEVPIKGSVFGEDGMNGMMGKLVTKQGAILGNALLAGIASGIGQGIAQASQVTATTALGSVSTTKTDTDSILKQGFGTGVGKALDRLAQYYINLAERTFPVIEVLPGRVVDIVIQQGVTLDVALASIGPAITGPTSRGSSPDNDRGALMKAARGEDDE